MQFTRGCHFLDPKEFPPSPNWVWDLPQTSVSVEIIDGTKVYEFPGDDFMEYYIQEVGFQPPRDFVRCILSEQKFPFFQRGDKELEEKVNLPIGFLRKNKKGEIVNTFGTDRNLSRGKKVFLHTLPELIEKELISRIAQINQAHRSFASIKLPSSHGLLALDDYVYPTENLFADTVWELGNKYSDSFQYQRIGWTPDSSSGLVYPASQDPAPADKLKAQIGVLCSEDDYLRDVSDELEGKESEIGVAFTALHTDPFYLEKVLNEFMVSMST